MRLYLGETIELIKGAMSSASWTTKQQVCAGRGGGRGEGREKMKKNEFQILTHLYRRDKR